MASTWPSEIALLRELVACPSVSGGEAEVLALAGRAASALGLDARPGDDGLLIEVRGRRPGPTLAFVSHLDTVPPGEGWTRDPFDGAIEGGCLFGRGSGDAKASVAAMIHACADVAAAGGPEAGRLVVLLGLGEETRDTTMPRLVERAEPIDRAVVGEPTGLEFAVAQRGLMMVDLVATGDQRHAGNAAEGGAYRNAIVEIARDLTHLDGLFDGRPHPMLGNPTVTPTVAEAGVGRNVTPPRARVLLDVRSTPAWTHVELAAGLREAMRSEVVVTSDRLVPCETPQGSTLLAAAEAVRPRARRFGSPTCSDWVFLAGRDVVKCGPGESRLSHRPDERVAVEEVSEARRFYAALVREVLR